MCKMKDLKIKLWFFSQFFFTVRVNGEEKEFDGVTNTVIFQLPEDADYEIELVQKQPPKNHKLRDYISSLFISILYVILIFFFQEAFCDEWDGDIQPFLLRAKIRGNMREHSELNFYYYKTRNLKGNYTKPRLVCDEIAPYEITYEANRMDIKNKFHGFTRTVVTNTLIVLMILTVLLVFGLMDPINKIVVAIVAVCVAATIAVCVFVLLRKHRKWYKYYYL